MTKQKYCYAQFHDGRNNHNCIGGKCQWYRKGHDCVMLKPYIKQELRKILREICCAESDDGNCKGCGFENKFNKAITRIMRLFERTGRK